MADNNPDAAIRQIKSDTADITRTISQLRYGLGYMAGRQRGILEVLAVACAVAWALAIVAVVARCFAP